MDQSATGGCLCGAIRYAVAAPLKNVIACHNAAVPTSAIDISAA